MENRKDTNDEISRQVWKEVEDKIDKARLVKAERKRGKKEKKEKEKKREFRKPTVEKEIEIARIIKEKQEEEEDLIEIRMVEEIVSKKFHKYLKVFEKREPERMLIRKIWNHAIDLREKFVPKKKIYLLSRMEGEEVQEFVKD